MNQRFRNLALAALLLADGVVLSFAGRFISDLANIPAAALIGLVLLMANLAAAFLSLRGLSEGSRRIALTLLLVLNAALIIGSGLYIGQTDDAPGAALIGFVLALANLAAAVAALRRRATA